MPDDRYESIYEGEQVDEAVGRALPNGALDLLISGKADKVAGATEDNIAALDEDGNLKDAGVSAAELQADIAAAQQAGQQNAIALLPTETAQNDPANSSFIAVADDAAAVPVVGAKLYGKSVVINQLVGIPTVSQSVNANNVTITDNRDGSYTIQTTAEGATADTLCHVCSTATNSIRTQNGHTYYKGGANIAQGIQLSDSYSGWNLVAANEGIFTRTSAGTGYTNITIVVKSGSIITTPIKVYPQTIDLTAIFTAAELTAIGTSVANLKSAWLKKFGYPLPQYIPYNAGSIVSNNATYQMHGRNVWDEQWELGYINGTTGQNASSSNGIRSKNYIPLKQGDYYVRKLSGNGSFYGYYYDANKQYISDGVTIGNSSAGQVITVPSSAAYIRFYMSSGYGTTYKNDICINLSDASFNGQYEAHFNGGSVTADNLNGIGTAMDEQDGEGNIVRKVGSVKVSDLTWEELSAALRRAPLSGMVNSYLGQQYALCPPYDRKDGTLVWADNDKVFVIGSTYLSGNYVYIKDSTYSTAAAFVAAMGNCEIVYELATPTTSTTSPSDIQTQKGYNSLGPVAGGVQSGEAEMTYKADIQLYVEKMLGQ